jgi:hypothetical protein
MMDITYSQRLSLLYGICLVEAQREAGLHLAETQSRNLQDYDAQEAATFLACTIAFKAIQQAGRSPVHERDENFEMLSVYQAFAMLAYAYLSLPLAHEGVDPDLTSASVTIAKTLFAELTNEEWAEIIESGTSKFQLIGDADQEHWMEYRQDLDKAVIAFLVAGTDDDAEFEKEEIIPLLGTLLSMLCEAFESY